MQAEPIMSEQKPAEKSPSLKWYVVNTYSGHENKARLGLIDRIKTYNLEASFGEVVCWDPPPPSMPWVAPTYGATNPYGAPPPGPQGYYTAPPPTSAVRCVTGYGQTVCGYDCTVAFGQVRCARTP